MHDVADSNSRRDVDAERSSQAERTWWKCIAVKGTAPAAAAAAAATAAAAAAAADAAAAAASASTRRDNCERDAAKSQGRSQHQRLASKKPRSDERHRGLPKPKT